MTKKLSELMENVSVEQADKEYDRQRDLRRTEEWQRENALSSAITFHKNNGGMMTPANLVVVADHFLKFLKGENQ